MFYDHDVIDGTFGNVKVYDLTDYPHTLDPTKVEKASLRSFDNLKRQEIIGLRVANKAA